MCMPSVARLAIGSLIVLGTLLLGITLGHYAPDSWLGSRSQSPPADVREPLAQLAIGGPFTLTDPAGVTVTQASFPGRWKLIYFGYTSCPDVCPTTLQAVAGALNRLGAGADRIVPLFITIDPGRDRPDVLARYTALFDRRMIGLTGTEQQIAGAERSFRVYAAKASQPGGSYLMDHTSFVYLLDPAGQLRALFDREATAATMAARLRQAMA